jgi:diguanylate cyclase (GGDEF)-like protein/PAS domain S-box-containing protein
MNLEAWSGWLVVVLAPLLAYQQSRLYRFRQEAAKREELFRIVAENAADMIALVDVKGRRLYNSPAYERVLGYTVAELAKTSPFEQIHQEDRFKVLEAGREAQRTGKGKKLEYRIRHKDGSWKTLESTASTIKDRNGVVQKLVIVNRDITERKRAEESLEYQSLHDATTGLPNRQLFLNRLDHAWARAKRNPTYQYAVLLLDVDGFHAFNETMGQAAGDRMILEIGNRLQTCLRQDDTVARPEGRMPGADPLLSRLGGDEFTLLLEEITDPSDAVRVAKRIQSAVAEPWPAEGREVLASVSAGIALSSSVHARSEDLLQDADTAMRRAKSMGGARCEVFDEAMHSQAMTRLQLEAELRAAVEAHQFELYYQPIVRLDTRQIVGLEALLRWRHPERGVISADKFIAVAEDVGLVVKVGKWVLNEACRQMQAWQTRFPELRSGRMRVNLSTKQLSHPGLCHDIKTALAGAALEPASLQLEIAESAAMADAKWTDEVISQLKPLGLRISLSEFGSGYSSAKWLRRLPVDELKIDRDIVRSVLTDRPSNDTVALIVSIGRALKTKVIAEGIESVVQLDQLMSLGCELGQGYLFSHPVSAEKVEKLVEQQGKHTAAGK